MCVKFITDIQEYVICVGMDVGIKSLLLLKRLIYVNFLWSISYFLQKPLVFKIFRFINIFLQMFVLLYIFFEISNYITTI